MTEKIPTSTFSIQPTWRGGRWTSPLMENHVRILLERSKKTMGECRRWFLNGHSIEQLNCAIMRLAAKKGCPIATAWLVERGKL